MIQPWHAISLHRLHRSSSQPINVNTRTDHQSSKLAITFAVK